MHKIDYIEVARALENKENLNLPEAEQQCMEQIWETAERFPSQFDTSTSFTKLSAIIDEKPKKSNNVKWLAAASILVALTVSVFAFFNSAPKSYATLKGETITIKLADQSEIVLQGASELFLDKKFNNSSREVKLEGVAHFDVAKDNTKPFIISTAKGNITVVGTSFTVYADDETERFALDVFEGKVKVNTAFDEKYLTQGMHLELDKDGNAIVTDDNKSVVFTSNLFNFKNTTVKDVITEIENQFGVSVQYDSKIAQERITLKTKADNAESLLLIISETLGTDFKVK